MKKQQFRAVLADVACVTAVVLGWAAWQPMNAATADAGEFRGKVLGANSPMSGSTVTLYAAGNGKPVQLAQDKTGDDGAFKLAVGANEIKDSAEKVFYLVSRGGTPKAAADKGPNEAIVLMALLGTKLPEKATVNELTTVASAFTAARFIDGESISGKPHGLRIAAGNTPNLVDPTTGAWGKVLLDPLNSSRTTTMATLDTLGSLISAYFTVADDAWRARFLKAATPPDAVTPKNTLEAISGSQCSFRQLAEARFSEAKVS